MPGIVVSPRARIFHGHDWVYASDIKKLFGNPQPGDIISLKDFRDRPLGTAIYNPNSQIVARRFSWRKQALNLDFFQRRFQRALEYRESLGIDTNLARLVWSESDSVPGIIIDRYHNHIVLQLLTLAMSQRREVITQAIKDIFNPKTIILRNDAPVLKAEGIEQEITLLHGSDPQDISIEANGIIYEVNLLDGQKTGLYLDQLEAHSAVAKIAKGKRVLDVFCNQGGFALSCAKAGASEVTAVDISKPAIQATKRNAELNALNIDVQEHNAFHFLKNAEPNYDLIILDPPSFTKNKKTLQDAMRGYKEIHLRALKMLGNGGILSTYCCSHHASRELFLQNIVSASVDAKKSIRLISSHGQRADHPILPAIPETEYLKGFTLEVIPAK